MQYYSVQSEESNRKKGMTISFVFHALIILLMFLPLMSSVPAEHESQNFIVKVEFNPNAGGGGGANSYKGRSSEGAARPLSESMKQAGGASASPIPVSGNKNSAPPPPANKNTKTQTSSKVPSDIFDTKSKVPSTTNSDLETNEIPRSTKKSNTKSSQVVVGNDDNLSTETVPTRKPSTSSGSGNGSAGPSNQNGTGTGQGKSGSGSGRDKTGNDPYSGNGTGGPGNGKGGTGTGTGKGNGSGSGTGSGSGSGTGSGSGSGNGKTPGTGVFDGSGKGIWGRQPIKKPPIGSLRGLPKGMIIFKVCIDNKGKNTFTGVMPGSTIKDKKALNLGADYVGRFIWEENYSAQKEQCGKYTLILEGE